MATSRSVTRVLVFLLSLPVGGVVLWLLSRVDPSPGAVVLLVVGAFVGGLFGYGLLRGRRRRSAWRDLGDDPALEEVDAPADGSRSDGFSVYEITVDDRTLRAHVETRGRETGRGRVTWTVVELPLQAFERGAGFVVEGDYRPEGDVPGEIRDRVVEATDHRDQLTVDGGTGVVRFETKGVVSDPGEVRDTAETVVAVARAVERDAGFGTRSDEETETTTEVSGRSGRRRP